MAVQDRAHASAADRRRPPHQAEATLRKRCGSRDHGVRQHAHALADRRSRRTPTTPCFHYGRNAAGQGQPCATATYARRLRRSACRGRGCTRSGTRSRACTSPAAPTSSSWQSCSATTHQTVTLSIYSHLLDDGVGAALDLADELPSANGEPTSAAFADAGAEDTTIVDLAGYRKFPYRPTTPNRFAQLRNRRSEVRNPLGRVPNPPAAGSSLRWRAPGGTGVPSPVRQRVPGSRPGSVCASTPRQFSTTARSLAYRRRMVTIEWYDGPRAALADLFALADDSPAAVSAYRDRARAGGA